MLHKIKLTVTAAMIMLGVVMVPAIAISGTASAATTPPAPAPAATGSKGQLCEGIGGCNKEGEATFQTIFNNIVNILLFIIGAVSVLMIIIGGIRHAVSAGDQSAVTSAKNTILYAIVGLVVAFMAYAIVNWVIGKL